MKPTAAMLAQELVHAYDLLERAIELALLHLQQSREPVPLSLQSAFWKMFADLDQYVSAQDSQLDDDSCHAWLYELDVETPRPDSPLVGRRMTIEGLRREFAGELTAE